MRPSSRLFDLFWEPSQGSLKLKWWWVLFFQYALNFIIGGAFDVLIRAFGAKITSFPYFPLSRLWRLTCTITSCDIALGYLGVRKSWYQFLFPASLSSFELFGVGSLFGSLLVVGTILALEMKAALMVSYVGCCGFWGDIIGQVVGWIAHSLYEEIQYRGLWWFWVIGLGRGKQTKLSPPPPSPSQQLLDHYHFQQEQEQEHEQEQEQEQQQHHQHQLKLLQWQQQQQQQRQRQQQKPSDEEQQQLPGTSSPPPPPRPTFFSLFPLLSLLSAFLSSLLFSLIHLQNQDSTTTSIANSFFFGFFLWLCVIRSRSLWFCVGVHMCLNGIQGVLGAPVSGHMFPGGIWDCYFYYQSYGIEATTTFTWVLILIIVPWSLLYLLIRPQ